MPSSVAPIGDCCAVLHRFQLRLKVVHCAALLLRSIRGPVLNLFDLALLSRAPSVQLLICFRNLRHLMRQCLRVLDHRLMLLLEGISRFCLCGDNLTYVRCCLFPQMPAWGERMKSKTSICARPTDCKRHCYFCET